MDFLGGFRIYVDFITVVAAILTLASMILAFISFHSSSKSSERLKELVEGFADSYLDEVTREIVRNLKSNTKLSKRMADEDRNEKEELGNLLSSEDSLIPTLIGSYSSFFIESGSTMAYLGKYLHTENCFKNIKIANITTNNILINHLLVFNKKVQIHMLPGTPVGQYGATYGNGPCEEPIDLVKKFYKWRNKSNSDRPLKSAEDLMALGQFDICAHEDLYLGTKEHMEDMYDEIRKFFTSPNHTPNFLLMTTSKLSVEDGPHVGSFQNNDFKRNMYKLANEELKIPFFMIVHDGKIHDGKITRNKCLPLFKRGTAGMIKAIGEGKLILVVTKSESPSSAISLDDVDESNASILFKKMVKLSEELSPEQAWRVFESKDRRVRIFIGEKSKCFELIEGMNWLNKRISA